MNFDKDYIEFVEYLEKTCVLRPVRLDTLQDIAVGLFVTYLNIRYAKTSPNPSLEHDQKLPSQN